MKSLVEFITESRINPKDVIEAIVGAYQQWESDLEDEPAQWSDIEDMYTADEPSDDVIKDICVSLGVKEEELKKFFSTPQGKTAWKNAQKEF
ncbi:MAG: hypothetical protein J1F35_06045 [Erysipelotrichales bacterium]|nr:hypothetical protein [Erysipelotrichales bacterium]